MREYSESDATIDLHLYNQFERNGNILENDDTSDIYKLFLSKNHLHQSENPHRRIQSILCQ